MRRIYFTSSFYDWSEDPTNTICYYDPATGALHDVSPNIDFDLGAGWLSPYADGRVLVFGTRGRKYVGPIVNYGDYWDGETGRVDLTEDAVMYTLSPELDDPQVLVRDVNSWYSDHGYAPTELVHPNSQFWNGSTRGTYDPNREIIVVVGRYYLPYQAGVDESEGRGISIYTPTGELVRREYPTSGFMIWQGNNPDGWTSPWWFEPSWVCYDSERGLAYGHDWWGLWQYNLETNVMRCAPAVFPFVTTQQGWSYGSVVGYLDNPDVQVMGPRGSGPSAYSFIEEKAFWRSRMVMQMDVDTTTGYIWAVVHGYEPYDQEYAVAGEAPPLSQHPGGSGQPGDQHNLLGIDPEKLFWLTDLYNPYPYDYVDDRGDRRSSLFDRFSGPQAEPPQIQADVKSIHLAIGKDIQLTDESYPGRDTTDYTTAESLDVRPSDPRLSEPYSWNNTGVALAAGFPQAFDIVTPVDHEFDSSRLRIEYEGDDVPTSPITFTMEVVARDQVYATTLDTDHHLGSYGSGVVGLGRIVLKDSQATLFNVIRTPGAQFRVTCDTAVTLRAVSVYLTYQVPQTYTTNGSAYFESVTVASDEGAAYVSGGIKVWDEEDYPPSWDLVDAVFRVDLETDEMEVAFADTRRTRYGEDPTMADRDDGTGYESYIGGTVFSILPGAAVLGLDGGITDTRRRFVGS